MARRKATNQEMVEAWKRAGELWSSLGDSKLNKPWVEAKFKLATLKITLNMQGLKNPSE